MQFWEPVPRIMPVRKLCRPWYMAFTLFTSCRMRCERLYALPHSVCCRSSLACCMAGTLGMSPVHVMLHCGCLCISESKMHDIVCRELGTQQHLIQSGPVCHSPAACGIYSRVQYWSTCTHILAHAWKHCSQYCTTISRSNSLNYVYACHASGVDTVS